MKGEHTAQEELRQHTKEFSSELQGKDVADNYLLLDKSFLLLC